jgi:hypothetical protein
MRRRTPRHGNAFRATRRPSARLSRPRGKR